jgi:4-hydroxybenzoate polyprenyltransferase
VKKIHRLLRAREWLHIPGLGIIGYFLNYSAFSLVGFAYMLSVLALSVAFAYSVNEFFDGKYERKYLVVPAVLFAGAAALSFAFSPAVFSTVLVGLAIPLVYSAYVKTRMPMLGMFLNAAGFGFVLLVGGLFSGPLTTELLAFFVFAAVNVLPFQLIHELAHNEGVATRLGRKAKNATRMSLALILVYAVFLYFLENNIVLLLCVVAFVLASSLILSTSWEPARKRDAFRFLSIVYGISLIISIFLK